MDNRFELPHDLLAEKTLLGCFLLDGRSFDEVSDLSLKQEDFYSPNYGHIFQAVMELALAGNPIDFVSVCSKLGDWGN